MRLNRLPQYVCYNHAVQVTKRIGCSTCHGEITAMQMTYRANAFEMRFCLDCHRNPEKYLRTSDQVWNMTGVYADWHLPLAHPLESWSDARSRDQTVGLIQPVIAPLYDGRTATEIVGAHERGDPGDGRSLLRDHWRGEGEEPSAFEERFADALRAGFLADTALPPESASAAAKHPAPAPVMVGDHGIEAVFRPHPTIGDGTHADLGWLQESPKPRARADPHSRDGAGAAHRQPHDPALRDPRRAAGRRRVPGPVHLRHGLRLHRPHRRAPAVPWNAKGLEWETASPPPTHNFLCPPAMPTVPYDDPIQERQTGRPHG
ncbi:hypothetical protein GCM10007888_43010 [Methylobacterium oxalidis]|uniref:LIM zinc-binding domain-containing protein n=1 Tax=Methylobacterium oxalidis TaxID=944322 RepID=A0ABQ6DP69_9HYPH|nr:hypothetical protein LDDCCGHA_3376 [Methylobacterium oxalidis]GLS65919.1 hypothetical protein GCM10007888_43010 [Methylobacterium oxalidis]